MDALCTISVSPVFDEYKKIKFFHLIDMGQLVQLGYLTDLYRKVAWLFNMGSYLLRFQTVQNIIRISFKMCLLITFSK